MVESVATRADAVLGCLLGGAIGDAVGGVGERGRLGLSDDTQLTLATCEAICETGRVEPAAIAAVFARWFEQRRLSGLGSSTLKALRDLQAGAHWALAGARGEMAAGNGGAMRIAPLAFLPAADRQVIRDVVRITHQNDEAYLGALGVVLALRGTWPASGAALLQAVAAELPDCRVRDQLQQTAELGQPHRPGGRRAVFGQLRLGRRDNPLALAVAWHMTEVSFAAGLDQLVRIGGDTDTIASIAAQVAGARLGAGRLPSDLLSIVPERELIEDVARRFSRLVEAPEALTSSCPTPRRPALRAGFAAGPCPVIANAVLGRRVKQSGDRLASRSLRAMATRRPRDDGGGTWNRLRDDGRRPTSPSR